MHSPPNVPSDIGNGEEVMPSWRGHSECLTRYILGPTHCYNGELLDLIKKLIKEGSHGVLVHRRGHEG